MKRLEIPEADLPTDLYEDDVFEKVENEFGKPIKNIYTNIYEENVSIMRFPLPVVLQFMARDTFLRLPKRHPL